MHFNPSAVVPRFPAHTMHSGSGDLKVSLSQSTTQIKMLLWLTNTSGEAQIPIALPLIGKGVLSRRCSMLINDDDS